MEFYEGVIAGALAIVVAGVFLGLISAEMDASFVNERPKDAAKVSKVDDE